MEGLQLGCCKQDKTAQMALAAGSLSSRFLLANGICRPSLVSAYIYAVFFHNGHLNPEDASRILTSETLVS
jgi:hypothetical protein